MATPRPTMVAGECSNTSRTIRVHVIVVILARRTAPSGIRRKGVVIELGLHLC
jgi:hypothetical protein